VNNEVEVKTDPKKAYVPDKDFILFYKDENVKNPQVLLEKHPQYHTYAGVIRFLPTFSISENEGTGEFIFVLDRSGSMSGRRIEMAKEAAMLFLTSLPVDCKFNVISFGNSFTRMFN